VRDVILAMSASTDSSANRIRLKGIDYAPAASFPLLMKAYEVAKAGGSNVHVGNVMSVDTFYNENPESIPLWAEYGVLALEMETTALYMLAAKFKRHALTVLTVSDHMITGEETTAAERQTTLNQMIEIGLETALQCP
jgi:purine-nucleoside phosphorylase